MCLEYTWMIGQKSFCIRTTQPLPSPLAKHPDPRVFVKVARLQTYFPWKGLRVSEILLGENIYIRNSLIQCKQDSPFSMSENSHFAIKSPIFEKRKFQYKTTKNLSCKQGATWRYMNPKEKKENVAHTILYDFFNISKFTQNKFIEKLLVKRLNFSFHSKVW